MTALSAPPKITRCDWHYLVSVVNASGTVSPCCGIQAQADDFGSVADSSFAEVWGNDRFRRARRLLASRGRTAVLDPEPPICHACPMAEDRNRADGHVERYLSEGPRWAQARARGIRPPYRESRLPLPKLRPRRRRRHRFTDVRYENLLLALQEQAAGVEHPRSRPIGLILDPSSACGLRCPMCPVSFEEPVRERTLLDWDLFERIVEELGPYLFFVDLFNWGEPLLHKQLPRMLRKLREYEIDVRLSSSLSVKLDDDALDALVENLDWLTVSIDGFSQKTYETYRRGGDLALALANLERIAARKRALRLRTPHVEWQYLVFSFNEHELDAARAHAKKLGVAFRPAAPFVDMDRHADWLSSKEEFVLDRYRASGSKEAGDEVVFADSCVDLRSSPHEAEVGAGFHAWEGGARWMSREGELVLRVPEYGDHLVLEGFATRDGAGPGAELVVWVDGEPAGRVAVGRPGAFAHRLPLNPAWLAPRAGRRIVVRLEATRSFVPADRGDSEDRRILSVQLRRVALAAFDARPPVLVRRGA